MIDKRRVDAELSRLSQASPSMLPPGGIGTIDFIVHCEADASGVLERAKVVLKQVVERTLHMWPPEEDEWFALLPEWFVDACSQEPSGEELRSLILRQRTLSAAELLEEPWELLGWIRWFDPDDVDGRSWYWWDAVIGDSHTIRVTVEVDSLPIPWGALDWLFRAAGAASVDPG